MFIKRYIKGLSVLWRSGRLLANRPKLTRYLLLPVLVTMAAYIFLLFKLYALLEATFSDFVPSLTGEDIWSILFYIFWLLLFVALFFYLASYSFISMAKVFSAPFNDLLSEKIELEFNPNYKEPTNAIRHFMATILPTVIEEIKKVTLISLGFVILFFLAMLPILTAFVTPVAFFYSILVVAIDFVDYPLARRQMSLKEKKKYVIEQLPELLGFGSGTFVLFLIPFLGLFVLPIAVVAGTLLFIDSENKDARFSS
jgi:CysZ protein